MAVILGDNIFQDNVKDAVLSFNSGARIFLKAVPDAARFGVAEVDEGSGQVLCIEEKPDVPMSDYAVTGLYIYDGGVFEIIKTLKPSGRGELEITDVNNEYIRQGAMGYYVLEGDWSDAGTFGSLLRAGMIVKKHREKKEGTTDEHRCIIITLLIYLRQGPALAKIPPAQRLNKHLTMKS